MIARHPGRGNAARIRLGVWACLLGERVRYDGGHERDRFLTDVLSPRVERMPGFAGTRARDRAAFHAGQERAARAHSPAHWGRLGRLVAGTGGRLTRARLAA